MGSTKNKRIYEAYFLDKQGAIIPIEGKHIDSILANPRRFGFSRKQIRAVYEKYGEQPEYGFEGNGRNQIILSLLLKGWTRIRIDKNNYINCQIAHRHSQKKIACQNVCNFLQHVRKTVGAKDYSHMGVLYYVDRDNPIINAYSTSGIKTQLLEKNNEV